MPAPRLVPRLPVRAPGACPRLATVAAGVLLCLVVLGCMSISFGGKSVCATDPEPFEQEGEVCLGQQTELDVYYPIPYASPPNLKVSSLLGSIEVLEQKPDHFRVRGTAHRVDWVARGVRVVPPPAVVVPGPPTPPPPALLPGPPLTPAPAPPPPEPRP